MSDVMSSADMASLVVAETDFALNLLKQTPVESAVFSPLSIAIALSVLFTGAKDKTKSEIGDAILKGANASQLEAHFGSLVSAVRDVNEAKVDIATRFFLAQDYPINDAYRQSIQKIYNADATTLNFLQADQAAETVNGFVNNATNGKIPQLVTADFFDEAVAVLINAVYFNAKWKTQFDGSFKKQFHADENSAREVDMMHLSMKVYFPYGENSRLQVVKLPYKNADFEFAIILPVTRFGLRTIHSSITGEEIQELFNKTKTTEMDLQVPKFHLETTLQLTAILKKLGINTAFSDFADFSLISTKPAKVSEAIHKAVITVDEAGTEAAAATAVRMIPMSMTYPKVFHADHPFLYAILYKNRPLFLGQYF